MASSDSNDDGARAITGINVTPLVDVTLVLLIVFMVTAKVVMSHAIPIQVPQVSSPAEVQQVVLAIGIATDGTLTLDGAPVDNPETLARLAKARAPSPADARAVIAASKTSSHGAVIGAVDALRSVGITKIAFAVDRKR